jgi:uncharacterized protein (TIGR03437 family)
LAVTAFGSNFGTDPTKTTVTVGGKSAYVFAIAGSYLDGQFNFQIPWATAVGPTTITITVNGIASTPLSVTISAVSPYFQSVDGSGSGNAFVYEANGTPVTAVAPASVGDTLVAYVIGLGQTTPPTVDTANGVASATAQVSPKPTITIGGVNAPVAFAGVLTSLGTSSIYQVNFTVPNGVSGSVPIVISIGGVTSTSVGLSNSFLNVPIASTVPAPAITGVQNSTFGTTLAPGSLAIVYGARFGTDATKVTVSVGGKPAYIDGAISAGEMLVQLPFEAATGATTITATVGGVQTNAFAITLAATAPAWNIQGSGSKGPAQVLETSNNVLVGLPATSPAAAPAKIGDTLYGYAIGLGATNPVSPTGLQTAANPTATTPAVTLGGIAATNISAVLTKNYPGIYQVNFTVPPGAQGTVPLVITIGGVSSLAGVVTIAVSGLSAVTNNASFANPGTASPGSIATAFANTLGTSTDELSGVFPSSSSEGVQVTFTGGSANGEGGPIFHVVASPAQQQVDLLVPTDLPTSGTVNVQLSTATTKYPTYTLNMVPANPGMYTLTDPVSLKPSALVEFNNSEWLVLSTAQTADFQIPPCGKSTTALALCGQPASPGTYLTIYLTGLGLATPSGDPAGKPLPTGQIAPANGSPVYQTPTLPTVTIGGVTATALFSGLTPGFAGLYQVDVQVPNGITFGDAVPLVISMLGQSDTETISVQASSVPVPAN